MVLFMALVTCLAICGAELLFPNVMPTPTVPTLLVVGLSFAKVCGWSSVLTALTSELELSSTAFSCATILHDISHMFFGM